MNQKITIAIDGYSSCGKSTLAKALASNLGYVFIDTGAMYRGVSLFCLQNSLIVENKVNESGLIKRLKDIELHFEINSQTLKPELFLNNINIDNKIRSIQISSLVSKVASIKEVRSKLVEAQRKMGENGGVVMDGRDIGSVVFPKAEVKFFVTSDPKIRAQRRFLELQNNGENVTLEEVEKNLKERDFLDTTREESPLIQVSDAIVIDNSTLTPQEQLNLAIKYVENFTTSTSVLK